MFYAFANQLVKSPEQFIAVIRVFSLFVTWLVLVFPLAASALTIAHSGATLTPASVNFTFAKSIWKNTPADDATFSGLNVSNYLLIDDIYSAGTLVLTSPLKTGQSLKLYRLVATGTASSYTTELVKSITGPSFMLAFYVSQPGEYLVEVQVTGEPYPHATFDFYPDGNGQNCNHLLPNTQLTCEQSWLPAHYRKDVEPWIRSQLGNIENFMDVVSDAKELADWKVELMDMAFDAAMAGAKARMDAGSSDSALAIGAQATSNFIDNRLGDLIGRFLKRAGLENGSVLFNELYDHLEIAPELYTLLTGLDPKTGKQADELTTMFAIADVGEQIGLDIVKILGESVAGASLTELEEQFNETKIAWAMLESLIRDNYGNWDGMVVNAGYPSGSNPDMNQIIDGFAAKLGYVNLPFLENIYSRAQVNEIFLKGATGMGDWVSMRRVMMNPFDDADYDGVSNKLDPNPNDPLIPRPTHSLTVTLTNSGTALIESNDGRIACGVTCQATYQKGDSLTLFANETPTRKFVRWTGACGGRKLSCSLTMGDSDLAVVAEFSTNIPPAEPTFGIKILSPNGGESLVKGEAVSIRYAYFGMTAAEALAVNIALYGDDGKVKADIDTANGVACYSVDSSWGATCIKNWVAKYIDEGNYELRISSQDQTFGNAFSDKSDAFFIIYDPKIIIRAPNGGEVLQTGDYSTIYWDMFRVDSTNVSIEWRNELLGTEGVIVNSTSNNGKYLWNIPSDMSDSSQMLIRIRAIGGEADSTYDYSDNYFSIRKGVVVPSSPRISIRPIQLYFASEGYMPDQKVTILKNTGPGILLISSIETIGDFEAGSDCFQALQEESGCTISVIYRPVFRSMDEGPPRNIGMVTVVSNAEGSPHIIDLHAVSNFYGFGGWIPQRIDTISILPDALFVGGTANVSATANSGLTVGIVSATPDSCSVVGSTVIGITEGLCTIILSQDGDAMYAEAERIWQTIVVNRFGPEVLFDSTSQMFAGQITGTTSTPKFVTLTNIGNATLLISSIETTGDYAVTHNCGVSLAASASCDLGITFTPTTTAGRIGSAKIFSDAPGSPHSVILSGTGIASYAPVCTLTANPTRMQPKRSAVLSVSCLPAATSITWTGGTCADTTVATCTVSPTATTSYSATGVNSFGSSTASATVTVKAVDLTPILMLLLD